jgi:[protein-PII] uridylyltransferase
MGQSVPARTDPKEFLRRYSGMVDDLVRQSFRTAQRGTFAPSACLMAVGGYGRSELAPFSDVDLLLLYQPPQKSDLPPLIEQTLYPLWDLGLDVSCSSRSVSESIQMAEGDLHVKTGLLDARYLDGDYDLFRSLFGLFTRKILHQKVHKFAGALARDLRLRHRKYEDPNCVLEPNLKEGPGGLRDFQVARWIIRATYRTDRWDSVLFPDQVRGLERSLDFFWALRNEIHLLTGRRQDDFLFELQEKVAPILGFAEGPEGVESMMREYHLCTRRVQRFAEDLLERVLHKAPMTRRILSLFQQRTLDKDFRIVRGEISLVAPATFKKDPSSLMTLFEHCQRYRRRMDLRTEEAVREALPFVDESFRRSDRVRQTFLSLLRKGENLGSILEKMHELGLLSQYLPEFSEIEGKVHHDLYHVHPVDIHSLLAAQELSRLREGNYQREYPLLTKIAQELKNPEILTLTSLLHDLGKGTEGDHSVAGAKLVRGIGIRLGLSTEEIETIAFLVSHHLVMLDTAFRRDLHDEQAIFHFANTVGTPRRLEMLYLLTFADIRAVGPEAWTTWKNSLLKELFLKTLHFFERDGTPPPLLVNEEIGKKISEWLPDKRVAQYADHLPARYLSCYSWEEIARHLEMAFRLTDHPLLVDWEIEERNRAKVIICTRDRRGLFSKIAGAMFLQRLNILEAQVHTWGNGVVLDTLLVDDVTQEVELRLHRFRKSLEELLGGRKVMEDLMAQQASSVSIPPKVVPKVPPQVTVNNRDSDFYTIIEVVGEDRLGILYELTRALADHGYDIHFARITTLGNRIVDVFYLQNTLGEKILVPEEMDRLQQGLYTRLGSRGA